MGRLFDRKPDKLLPRTLCRIRVTAHVILKVREEDAMNDSLFAPLSNYRERDSKLTGISNCNVPGLNTTIHTDEYRSLWYNYICVHTRGVTSVICGG